MSLCSRGIWKRFEGEKKCNKWREDLQKMSKSSTKNNSTICHASYVIRWHCRVRMYQPWAALDCDIVVRCCSRCWGLRGQLCLYARVDREGRKLSEKANQRGRSEWIAGGIYLIRNGRCLLLCNIHCYKQVLWGSVESPDEAGAARAKQFWWGTHFSNAISERVAQMKSASQESRAQVYACRCMFSKQSTCDCKSLSSKWGDE